MELVTSILFATVVAGTPLIIVALGQLIAEKAGVLNLGAEGMMSMGAIAAFAITLHSGSALLGVLAGIAAGALMSLLFAIVVLTLMGNQVASGLALSILGVGLSAFIGKAYESEVLPTVGSIRIPLLADIPVIGEVLFDQQALIYFSWALFGAIVWFLYRSRPGLVLRAIGESPAAAHSIGYPVIRIRYLATLFGGAMAGIGGAFLSVFYTPLWVEGMVAGRGSRLRWWSSPPGARCGCSSAPTCSAASSSRSCSCRVRGSTSISRRNSCRRYPIWRLSLSWWLFRAIRIA